MASKAVKKHRNLKAYDAHCAGYNCPNPPKSKAGGGYPHHQPFKRPGR